MSGLGRRRLLVTGANGFVGSALTRILAGNSEFEAVAAVRDATKKVAGTPSVVVGNIDAATNWTHALAGIDTVVHLAARVHVMRESAGDPLALFREVNVDGTRALAEEAARNGVRRLVFLSSIKVNGEAGHFTETDTPHPIDAYGLSKYEAELALRDIASKTKLEIVIVRPPLVYGPGVKANFRMLLRQVERGVPLPLGSVQNKRSFVGVNNLAEFLVVSAQHPRAANETFLVSDADDVSTPELIQRMAAALGKPARLFPMPVWMLMSLAALTGQRAAAERLVGSLQVDIQKASEQLGWSPRFTMHETLRETVRP